MPLLQDVLNESFRCLDRDDLDFCQDVCRRWKATIDLMADASLALRQVHHIALEKIKKTKCGTTKAAFSVLRAINRSNKLVHRTGWDIYPRTMALRKKSGGVAQNKLETTVCLLRNSYVADMVIRCLDSENDAVTLLLLRELQNCQVRRIELKGPTVLQGSQMLHAAAQNLRVKEYELHFKADAFGTPAWKEMVFLDFVQRADKLALTMMIKENEPLGLEWIDDLVEMRDVKEVSLELDGEEGQAEMLLERLIEDYLKNPTGFPRKLKLWPTSTATTDQWARSLHSGKAVEKRYRGPYSTFHFAESSGNAGMTVASTDEYDELGAVYLYQGRVDIIAAFPDASKYADRDEYEQSNSEVEWLDDF